MPDILVNYHGEVAQKKLKQVVHPMTKLKNFIERKNIRLLDFFNMLDSDHSMSISREEFSDGIEVKLGPSGATQYIASTSSLKIHLTETPEHV